MSPLDATLFLPDEEATFLLGAELARCLDETGVVVFLEGDLGAGKTTLVRGLVRALGHQGAVRSPTYTLVESYEVKGRVIHHFDLYRLAEPEELEYLGVRDYFNGEAVCFVEWPGKGEGLLPPPDLTLFLEIQGEGRGLRAEGNSARGERLLRCLESRFPMAAMAAAAKNT